MKITHWNISKKDSPMLATRRYEDELFNNLKEFGISVERIQRDNAKLSGSTVFSWPFYGCRGADIVHATFQTIAPAIYFNKPKRFIVTVHDLAPLVYPSIIKDISVKIQWSLTPKALKKAHRIIAISNFTKNEIIRLLGIDENKIDVIYQGIDHNKYKPIDKIMCKKRFSLNPVEKHILVVSSNLEYKRMDLAMRVFEKIRETREDIRMIKAGYGEVLNGDGIISIGWVPEEDMPLLFNAADVYLHTSEYEGFGLPVLEAMACGVPVVAGDRASIPEVVGDDAINIDSRDSIQAFSERILSLIDSGFDNEAIKRSKKFTWIKTAKDTARVYEDIYLAGGSGK